MKIGMFFRSTLRGVSRANVVRRAAIRKASDGISQDIQYIGLRQQLLTFPKRRPYAFNVMVATFKTALADYLVQKFIERKEKIDWKRNAVFVAFGGLYLGMFQWFIYVTCFARLCPNAIKFANMSWKEKMAFKPGQIDLAKQIFLDNFVHYTFIYFPVFYVFKESIQGGDKNRSATDIISTGFKKYLTNFWPDNINIWALWIPGDAIIYAVPIWMRLPMNHALSLLWTMILSFMRGDEIPDKASKNKVVATKQADWAA